MATKLLLSKPLGDGRHEFATVIVPNCPLRDPYGKNITEAVMSLMQQGFMMDTHIDGVSGDVGETYRSLEERPTPAA